MEEHEKWLKTVQGNKYACNRFNTWDEEVAAERGWKAALEYALSTRASSHRNIISAEFLKKELEDA